MGDLQDVYQSEFIEIFNLKQALYYAIFIVIVRACRVFMVVFPVITCNSLSTAANGLHNFDFILFVQAVAGEFTARNYLLINFNSEAFFR